MTHRKVFGTILQNDQPLAGGLVRFKRKSGTYTSIGQQMATIVNQYTDANGYFEVYLSVGDWLCMLPDGDSFDFSLPPGSTAIDIGPLREFSGNPNQPIPDTLLSYVQQSVATAVNEAIAVMPTPTPTPSPVPASGTKRRKETLDLSHSPIFQLKAEPINPQYSQLFVNGELLRYGESYVVNGSLLRLHSGYEMTVAEDWKVDFYYDYLEG